MPHISYSCELFIVLMLNNSAIYMKIKIILSLLLFPISVTFSQVGIGTITPHPSSLLEVSSVTGGVLVPRMTLAQKTAIIPNAANNGLLIYQTDGSAGFWYCNGVAWVTFTSSGWSLIGDGATNPATNFLGTTDNNDFTFATANTERIRVKTDGNIGINQNNPTAKLHITGTAPVFRLQDGSEATNKVLTSDANGNAKWGPNNLAVVDDDWRFTAGTTFADPAYHKGPVVIGRSGPTTHHLDVDNGSPTGTTIGIGDVEKIIDGSNETIFSHRLVSFRDNQEDFGHPTNRWNTIYATNGVVQTSDKNKKIDIKPISYGIKEVMKLNPVSYYWKEEKCNNLLIPENKKQLKLGVIAQELEKIIPEAVYTYEYKHTNEESDTFERHNLSRIGVNYEELIPILVKAKQEQDLEVIKLKVETEALAERVKQLSKSN